MNSATTLEGMGSGYQDGRRTGISDTSTVVGEEETCKTIKVAFVAHFYDDDEPVGSRDSEGVFVAFIESCEPEECTSCLCSQDPECEFGAMTLGAGPDFNGDEMVDEIDLNLMVQAIGYTTGRFDLNEDDIVDGSDVELLMSDWGEVTLD